MSALSSKMPYYCFELDKRKYCQKEGQNLWQKIARRIVRQFKDSAWIHSVCNKINEKTNFALAGWTKSDDVHEERWYPYSQRYSQLAQLRKYYLKQQFILHPKSFKTWIQGPILLTWIDDSPACVSNHIHYEVWNTITYLFPNFNGCTIEIWELILLLSNFNPRFTGHVITDPC